MPDLQTEMQKILQSWEQPETTEQPPKDTDMFTAIKNTSRDTFNAVRDNPGLPKPHYVSKLKAVGHNKSSVYSLLAQMIRQGHLLEDSAGLLRPNQAEYKPLKSSTTIKNAAKKAAKKAAKTSKLITSKPEIAPVPLEEVKQAIIGKPVRSNIEVILDTISLSEGHELYRKLHQYFGGLPK